MAECGDTCIIGGQPIRKTEDVIDELAQTVIDTGGTVEHVTTDSPVGEPGLAAELRFPLLLKPGDQA